MLETNNPKILASCSFYKETSHSLEKKGAPFVDRKLGNKTNYFPQTKRTHNNEVNNSKVINPIDEFPGTWKKGAPKINSSKLPSAFGTIFQKTVKNPKDPIKSIENIVNMQEYKQAVQLLSPLKLEEKRPPKTPKDSKFSRKSHKRPKKSNPLEPLRSYMENFSKVSKEMLSELPSNISSLLQRTSLVNSKVKLEELITISMKRSAKGGVSTFKKMLHVPGLQLFGLKEIPLRSPDMRKTLKDWISAWQTLFQSQRNAGLVKVHGTFWNCPEGNVSILMELMSAGSLQGLIESVGGLTESMLCLIAQHVLNDGLRVIHEQDRYYEGSLTPEQVLLDREGNIKISLGLSTNKEIGSPLRENPTKANSSIFKQNPRFQGAKHLDLYQNNDLYNLGVIILMAAIGDIALFGAADEDISDQSNKNNGFCCFLHAEKQVSPGKKLYLLDILEKKRYSKEFIGFLCQALRYKWEDRGSIESLTDRLRSVLLPSKSLPPLTLRDLIKVGLFYENPAESQTGLKFLDKLMESVKVVIPNCENWFKKEEFKPYLQHLTGNFNEDNEVFRNLEKELGVRKEVIFEKMRVVLRGVGFGGGE